MKKSSAKPKARPTPVKAATAKKAVPVKATKKVVKAPKPVAKKAVKVVPKAKPKAPSKPSSKAPIKTSPKAAVKTPTKTAVKAKPVAGKKGAQTAAPKAVKVAVKTPAKKVLPLKAAQKGIKAPVKAAAKKVPAKVSAKTAEKTAIKTTVRAPLKSTAKAPVNAPLKSVPKTPAPAPLKGLVKPAFPAKLDASEMAAQALALKKHENHQPVVAGQSIAQPQSKKSSRGAKAASMVPPPPVAVVSNNAAKSSFGPSTTPSLPSVIPVTPKKDSKLANNWKNKPVDQLSDAELLSMSDTEYMNDTQMAFFKLKLVALKRDILANAGQTTENLREETVVVPDPADRATIEEEHALELRTRDRERKLLKKIEQSIHRIDGGDYGYCDETGEAIGVGRLLARPTATLSLEAQQRRELKQKMFGD